MLEPIFKFFDNYKKLKQHKQDIYRFIDKLTENYEREYQSKIKSNDSKPQVYLDQIYGIRDTMTRDELREEIFAFLIGAFDTTGKALPGVLLSLAMNQEIQEKVFLELKSIFVSEDDEADEERLNKMVYLDLVIKESLRQLPIALTLLRHVKKDIKLCNFPIYLNLTSQ